MSKASTKPVDDDYVVLDNEYKSRQQVVNELTRQIQYLTPRDIQNEKRIMKRIEEAWKCGIFYVDDSFTPIDFYAVDDPNSTRPQEIFAWIEAKSRNATVDTYDTIWLSLRKVEQLIRMREITGVPGLFFVEFRRDGNIGYVDVDVIDKSKVVRGGTKKRNTNNAEEPMVVVKVSDFKLITNKSRVNK